MDREWKQVLIVVGIIAILIVGCFAGIKAYSGLDNSITVVVSGSMQHSDQSEIGVIDTGDMVVMKNKNNGIVTYVEGYDSGYSKFGEYGDVVIYDRLIGNPVIHRAIVWLDYNPEDNTYSAPSLNQNHYGKNAMWISSSGNNQHFTWLWMYNLNSKEPIKFDMDDPNMWGQQHSGYLTKGDSVNNHYFDCMTSTITNKQGMVTYDQIKAVAGFEIPWLGAIKLYINGNTEDIQSNTPFCLAFLILDILALIGIISIIWDIIDRRFPN